MLARAPLAASATGLPRPARAGSVRGAAAHRVAARAQWSLPRARAHSSDPGRHSAALVRPRLLRHGQRHARAVGSAAASRFIGSVSLLTQPDVRRRQPDSVGMGDRVQLVGARPLRAHRDGGIPPPSPVQRRALSGADARTTLGRLPRACAAMDLPEPPCRRLLVGGSHRADPASPA